MSDETPVYVISVAAQLLDCIRRRCGLTTGWGLSHPAAVRAGTALLHAGRPGLREVQRLSQDEGVNLSGIKRILELNDELDRSRRLVADLHSEVAQLRVELESTRSVGRAAG